MELYERLLEYSALGNVAHGAVVALDRYLQERPLPQEDREALSRAIDHVGQAQEGFHLTLRATSVADLQELRGLVERLLLAEDWPEDLNVALQQEEVAWPRLQVFIFAHSLTALAILPRMGGTHTAASFTYADLSFPSTPAELLGRFEELERVVWLAMGGPPRKVESDPLRRAYGFFEASRWLAASHLQLFLGRGSRGVAGGRAAA